MGKHKGTEFPLANLQFRPRSVDRLSTAHCRSSPPLLFMALILIFSAKSQSNLALRSPWNFNWNQVPSSLSAIAIIIITYNDSSEFARTTQGPYHDSSWEGLSSNRLQEASNTRNYKNTFRKSMKKWTGVRKSEAIKCT